MSLPPKSQYETPLFEREGCPGYGEPRFFLLDPNNEQLAIGTSHKLLAGERGCILLSPSIFVLAGLLIAGEVARQWAHFVILNTNYSTGGWQNRIPRPPGDPQTLARALGAILADPEAAGLMWYRSRGPVAERYAWPHIASLARVTCEQSLASD